MPAAGFFDNLGNTIHDVGQAILSMSGPKASNLSDAHYGYDYVVATTQASIDAAMKKFLSKHTEPTTTVCFVADSKGHPQPISFDELKNNAGGVDPFGIPQGADPASDASLQALRRARFMMGFRATLGWPRGLAPDATTIVNLGANTASVEFNMVCADFHVVELNPGTGWDPTPSWLHLTQSPDHPWIFSSKVDMRRVGLDPQMYTKMPNEMQTQINKFITNGAPFSVETLLFDLSNAALQTTPTISGVEAGTDLYRILQTYFIGAYLTQLKLHGEPVLGAQLYAHQPDQATLRMTGYEVEVNPYTDPAVSDVVRQRATTLNYLCTTHATLPPSVQFAWNWVDAADLGDHDGIVAINRNAMRDYLSSHLYGAAKGNCIRPESGSFRNGPGNRYELHLYWDREPTLNTNFPTGSTIFRYEFDSGESYDRSAQDWGDMITQCWYWLQCDIKDETIIITQQLHFYLHLRVSSPESFYRSFSNAATVGGGENWRRCGSQDAHRHVLYRY
jgi:hypothetical protein